MSCLFRTRSISIPLSLSATGNYKIYKIKTHISISFQIVQKIKTPIYTCPLSFSLSPTGNYKIKTHISISFQIVQKIKTHIFWFPSPAVSPFASFSRCLSNLQACPLLSLQLLTCIYVSHRNERERESRRRRFDMQQRKSTIGNGRPSGTDGSDFSYRMVVDSRYTKVAKGKSRLSKLILAQAIVELVGVLTMVLSILKEEIVDRLAVSSVIIGFVSLIIGELGRRRSRINFLKCYMFASSIAILLSIACVLGSKFSLEVFQDISGWETKKFELFRSASVVVGLMIQIYAIKTTASLIHNMSPPKRAS